MIVLAIDSTAKTSTVALLDDGAALATYSIEGGLTQSELLLPMVENMLSSLKVSVSDIGLFAVSVGPGSFTGVRIGTALIKGLAFGRDIPSVAVSTLEALSENLSGISGIVVPVMDARRDQVYTAIFKSSKDGIERLSPDEAISVSALTDKLLGFKNEEIYIVGDGYEKVVAALDTLNIPHAVTPELLRRQNAFSVGRVGLSKFAASDVVSDAELLPTYLRVPQAERERLEREAAK